MSEPSLRRARVLRRDRRSCLQEDLSVAAGDGQARSARRAGHRRRQGAAGDSISCRRERATASRSTAAFDAAAFEKLCGLLRYVDGDYATPRPSQALRKELGSGTRPAHYLAIPPSSVRHSRRAAGATRVARRRRARHRREAVRPRPGLGAGAQRRSCCETFDEQRHLPHRPLPRQGAGAQHAVLPFRQRLPGADLESQHIESVQITMAEDFGVQGRGAFYEETGAIRDVVQNHLFQVLAQLAMEPPVADRQRIDPRRESEGAQGDCAARAAKTSCAANSAAIATRTASRADSQVETFAALRLDIDSWRWQGVPFYIRAGKSSAGHVYRSRCATALPAQAL